MILLQNLKHTFRALRHRNYRLYFSGQSVSLIGTWMQQMAISWLMYRITPSPFMLGLVGFLGQIPTLLFTPFAGVFADRLFFRLDAEARAALGDRALELRVFEPVKGRAMKAYMELPGKPRDDTLFADLLGLAVECAKALPAKEKKPKGK